MGKAGDTSGHISVHLVYCIYIYKITTLLRGGRAQIARHNLDVFEGGGPGKCQQAFIFLTAFYLQDFILVGPLTLYGISFIFLKNAGGRSKCPIAFLKKNARK